jgi:hypothetical protein
MADKDFTALTPRQIAERFTYLSLGFHQANQNQGNRPCESHRYEDCPAEVCRNNRMFAEAITALHVWRECIAEMEPWIVTREDDEVCRFCGFMRMRIESHEPGCLWQNAKDATAAQHAK